MMNFAKDELYSIYFKKLTNIFVCFTVSFCVLVLLFFCGGGGGGGEGQGLMFLVFFKCLRYYFCKKVCMRSRP